MLTGNGEGWYTGECDWPEQQKTAKCKIIKRQRKSCKQEFKTPKGFLEKASQVLPPRDLQQSSNQVAKWAALLKLQIQLAHMSSRWVRWCLSRQVDQTHPPGNRRRREENVVRKKSNKNKVIHNRCSLMFGPTVIQGSNQLQCGEKIKK